MVVQRTRELSVKRKLNAMPAVFSGRNVLLVDDSIVRGTTMRQIVDMVRRAGAKKVSQHCLYCEHTHHCTYCPADSKISSISHVGGSAARRGPCPCSTGGQAVYLACKPLGMAALPSCVKRLGAAIAVFCCTCRMQLMWDHLQQPRLFWHVSFGLPWPKM